MCGIAGIIQPDPSWYSQEQLKKMTDALAHRGPDGAAGWQNESGNTLLGHRRLSIIDLSSAASQPLHYLGRYTIVHNGEIYNYIELRNELQQLQYKFQTHSDTEVILAAYDYWEDECVDHFDGMFSFAIWDEKEQELFAARDRFGEKPFYYFFDGQRFLFGSEIKALWAAGVERKSNHQMLFNFLTIGYTDNPTQPDETFFENIKKLPAAACLIYSPLKKELIIEKYWDLDPEKQNKKISDAEAIEQFNELFDTSVKRRLRCDVSIGSSLSGGLDSSSVLATMMKDAPGIQDDQAPFRAFTAIFPGFEKDEYQFSKKVADSFNLQQSTVAVTVNDLVNDWNKLIYHQEEPFGSAGVYAQYKVFQLAKENNVKVLLDGQGADETLAGYHKYYKWYWQELFHKRKLLASKEFKAAKSLGVQEKFGVSNVIASLFPELASVFLERQYLLKAIRQEDLTRDFVKQQSREAYYARPAYFNLNGALYFNTITHGLEELLRYADRNSMAHGREVRLPFLSHELVEFIFTLPAHLKIRQGWTKWLLRKSMDKVLPDDITWRKDKIGFEPPQQQWMKNQGMIDILHEAKKKMIREKILKPATIDKSLIESSAYAPDNYDWRYMVAAAYL